MLEDKIMNSLLPTEIYNIIVGYIPVINYSRFRLVCRTWWEIIEVSEYKEVIRWIRILCRDPNYIKDIACDIHFWDGTIRHDFHGYTYRDQNLINIDTFKNDENALQIITNEYGTFKLWLIDEYVKVSINGTLLPIIHCLMQQPYFIRTDNEIHIMNGDVFRYDTDIGWKRLMYGIVDRRVTINYIYRKFGSHIDIYDTHDKELGTINFPSKTFGIGINYFAIYDKQLKIYHI